MDDVILLTTPRPGVAVITMNRPERLNAINEAWIRSFHRVLDAIASSDDIRAVILTGAGRGFCAGADMTSDGTALAAASSVEAGYAGMGRLSELVRKLTLLSQPVIAAVNGPAMGAGLALALGADIRLISTRASFGVANVRIGLSAGDAGISWRLPRLVGLSRSLGLMLTGRTFDAGEAYRLGVAAAPIAPEDLLNAAFAKADQIAANAPFAVMMSKDVIYTNLGAADLATAMALENRTQILCNLKGYIHAAMAAFREKRAVRFGEEAGFDPAMA